MELRDYQVAALEALGRAFVGGHRAPLLVAPTGSGKTVIAAAVIDREVRRGRRVAFLAPRRELIAQTCMKLDTFGIHYGVVMAGDPRSSMMAPVQVCSVDTLRSRLVRSGRVPMAEPEIVIIDEAHLYVTAKRKEVVGLWPAAICVGLSATPVRGDGRGLGVLFDELIEVATVGELTEHGFLAPARYYSLSEPDLQRVQIRAGDYALGELSEVMSRTKLVADVVSTWMEHAGGRRTAVFAVDRRHSAALAEQFQAQGVAAEHVDGAMPAAIRDAVFARFRGGETQVLCNCQLAQYGFDLPAMSCVVLARPTRSLPLYLQMIGRGLRPADGKADCLILDHSGAVLMHGLADQVRNWTLEGCRDFGRDSGRKGGSAAAPTMIKCPKCTCVFSRRAQCPSCGWWAPVKPKAVSTLEGELVEVGNVDRCRTMGHQRRFYQELLGYVRETGKRPGYAAHRFREKYGEFPPWDWQGLEPLAPGMDIRRWLKSRQIAYARARAACL